MFQVAYGKMFEKAHDVEFRTISKWEGDILFKNCGSKLIPDKKFRNELIEYGSSSRGHSLEGWTQIIKKYNLINKNDITFIYPHDIGSWSKPKHNLALDCACWDSEYVFKQYNKKDLKYRFGRMVYKWIAGLEYDKMSDIDVVKKYTKTDVDSIFNLLEEQDPFKGKDK